MHLGTKIENSGVSPESYDDKTEYFRK